MVAFVEQEPSQLRVSGVGLRALAAVLDGVALAALFVLPAWIYLWNQPVSPQDTSTPASAWFLPVAALLWAVYLTVPTWRGATLGMRAVGLGVVRAGTQERLGFGRSAVRSLALIAVVWALFAVRWWLVPLYGALMVLTAARRLPHDVLVGSAVVRTFRGGGAAGTALARTQGLADLDPAQARALLQDMGRVERAVRADLHVPSVAVLTLGVLGLAGATVALPDHGLSPWSLLYWAVAAPAGLILVLVLSVLVQRRAGIRRSRGWLVAATLVMLAAAVVGAFTPLGPALVGLAFLAVAAHESSRLVAVAAAAFAVVVGIQELTGWFAYSLISNRIPDTALGDLMSQHGSAVVEGLVGTVLLVVGLVAYRSERAAR
jgi:RDD family